MCKSTLINLDCGHSREHIQRGKTCKRLCEDSARNTTVTKGQGKCHKCSKHSTAGRSLQSADVPVITTKLANIQVSAPATPVTKKLPSSSQIPVQPTKPQPAAAGVSTKNVSFVSASSAKPQPAATGGPTKTTGFTAPAKAPLVKATAKPTAGTSSMR